MASPAMFVMGKREPDSSAHCLLGRREDAHTKRRPLIDRSSVRNIPITSASQPARRPWARPRAAAEAARVRP